MRAGAPQARLQIRCALARLAIFVASLIGATPVFATELVPVITAFEQEACDVQTSPPGSELFETVHTCNLGNGHLMSVATAEGRSRVVVREAETGLELYTQPFSSGFITAAAPVSVISFEDESWGLSWWSVGASSGRNLVRFEQGTACEASAWTGLDRDAVIALSLPCAEPRPHTTGLVSSMIDGEEIGYYLTQIGANACRHDLPSPDVTRDDEANLLEGDKVCHGLGPFDVRIIGYDGRDTFAIVGTKQLPDDWMSGRGYFEEPLMSSTSSFVETGDVVFWVLEEPQTNLPAGDAIIAAVVPLITRLAEGPSSSGINPNIWLYEARAILRNGDEPDCRIGLFDTLIGALRAARTTGCSLR